MHRERQRPTFSLYILYTLNSHVFSAGKPTNTKDDNEMFNGYCSQYIKLTLKSVNIVLIIIQRCRL